MSNPGMMTNQMTPELMAQMQAQQDQQRKMAMAQSLMGNQAKGTNSGMANAGNDILGAITMHNLAQKNDPTNQMNNQTMQQRYGMDPSQAQNVLNPSLMSKVGGLFNLGGQ